MGAIQKIGVEAIPVPTVPIWKIQQPESLNIPAPVTVNLGFPIIDMPGCIVTRKNNRENKSTVSNDESGNVVLCQAEYPAYDAMDYTPEELLYTSGAEPPRYSEPPIPAQDPPTTPKIEACPPPGAAEVGTKIEDGRKEIIGYQLIGNRCVTQYKKLTTKQQIINAIPSAPQVVSTTGITLIATSAALATPILLKLVKPIIKQTINKIKKKLGKPVKSLTPSEKRANSYREKRGLPPLKV